MTDAPKPIIDLGMVRKYLAKWPAKAIVVRTHADYEADGGSIALDTMMAHLEAKKPGSSIDGSDKRHDTEAALAAALHDYIEARTTKSSIDDMVDTAMAGVNQALKEDWGIEA